MSRSLVAVVVVALVVGGFAAWWLWPGGGLQQQPQAPTYYMQVLTRDNWTNANAPFVPVLVEQMSESWGGSPTGLNATCTTDSGGNCAVAVPAGWYRARATDRQSYGPYTVNAEQSSPLILVYVSSATHGVLRAVVTWAADGSPAGGALVTATPSGMTGGAARTCLTAFGNGTCEILLPSGTYDVVATWGIYPFFPRSSQHQTVQVIAGQVLAVNLELL